MSTVMITTLSLTTAAVVLMPGVSSAVTVCPSGGASSWTNSAGGSFDDSSNWSNGVPGGDCDATIALPGTYTVVSNGDDSKSLALGSSTGTQTLALSGSAVGAAPQDAIFNIGAGGLSIGAHGVVDLTAIGANPGGVTTTGSGLITNDGLLETDAGSGAGNRDIQNNVLNDASGTISLTVDTNTCGCGGTHTWTNHGTMKTAAGTESTFTGTAAGVDYIQAGGTFANAGRAIISGGFTHTGGTTTGNPIEVCGSELDLPDAETAAVDVRAEADINCSTGSDLTGDIGAGNTVTVYDASPTYSLGLNVTPDVTNYGTLNLDGAAGASQDQVVGGGTLTNAGTLNLSQPGSGLVAVTLHNTGTVAVAAGASFELRANDTFSAGTLSIESGGAITTNRTTTLSGGTITNNGSFLTNGEFDHIAGTVTGQPIELCGAGLAASGAGQASFRLITLAGCSGGGLLSDIATGNTVDLRGGPVGLDVSFAGTLDNHGVLRFDGTQQQVQLHGNTLINDGTIDFAEASASVNIDTAVVNDGQLESEQGASPYFTYAAGQSAGRTTVDGSITFSQPFDLAGGTLRGAGTVVAVSGLTNSGGTVHPGHSPGTLAVTGSYTQGTGGALGIDVAGASAGSGYSRLTVSGTATLAGALQVATTRQQTGPLHILTAGALSGTFTPTIMAGERFSVGYTATGVSLSGTPAPTGRTAPRITGKAVVGRTLTAGTGRWTGRPTSYSYRWLRCNRAGHQCTVIAHATKARYRVTTHDVARRLQVRVTAHNAGGRATATSAVTPVVPKVHHHHHH